MRCFAPALLASALAVAACGGPPPVAPGPERTQVELTDADVRAIARVLAFEDRREFDPVAFDRLADGREEVRRRVALAAGRIGDPGAVSLLTRLLDDDPSTAVRADAAFALGLLGDTSDLVMASLREAVPGSWVPPRTAETDVVVEVVQALARLGTFDARALVVDALRAAHPGSSENGRRVAAGALLGIWRFRDGPGRANAVVRYVDVPDPELRWRAGYALMRLAEPEAVPRLFPLLADDDHRARAQAARALAAPVVDSAGFRDSAVVALAAALDDEHPHVRINAVRALGTYGDDAPVPRMAALLADPVEPVAFAAAGALAPLAARARDSLAAVLDDPARPFPVRAQVARALADVDPDGVGARVGDWAGGGVQARYAAARTLTALGWDAASALFPRLAADDDLRVAVAAVAAAGEVAADTLAPADERAALRGFLEGVADRAEGRLVIVAVRGLEPLLDTREMERTRARAGVPDEPVDEAADRTPEFYEDIVRSYIAGPLAGERRPRAVIEHDRGDIVVELLAEEAPLTVHNFITLARDGVWDDGVWHRVIPNFVIQDGAPAGDPSGGPGWTIRDEINRIRYARGVMGMALSGPNTGGSQWFITHSPQHHLDGGYTVFGRVTGGMDVVDAVLQGDPIPAIRVP